MNSNYNIDSIQESQITSETNQFLEKTLNRFDKSKKRVQKFISYYHAQKNSLTPSDVEIKENVLHNVSDCGSWLEFRNYYKQDTTKLHKANFCKKDKLCPACAMRRASKQVQKVYTSISRNSSLQKKHWYYVVLPVKHYKNEDFETVQNRAKAGLNSLRWSINEAKKKKTTKNFFSQFDGMFYSFEVTKTENGWNVHINLLCCSDKEIPGIYKYKHRNGQVTSQHQDIMRDWSKYTDNNSYMHSINKIDISTKDLLIKNLLEVFKYSLKFQDLDDESLLEVYDKTYRKRLMGALGSLYKINFDVDLNEEETLDNEFLEIIFTYCYKENKYIKRSIEKVKLPQEVKKKREINRNDLLKPKRSKYIKVKIFDKDNNLKELYFKRDKKTITDYEIFQRSIVEQRMKKAPQVQRI